MRLSSRSIDKDGYVCVYQPMHPRAQKNGMVLEHLLVAERALGRSIPVGVEIHHVDEDRARNVGANLVICPDKSYHKLLHKRMRALQACGNPDALRCLICHHYDRQENITETSGGRAYHRNCAASYNRKRRTKS